MPAKEGLFIETNDPTTLQKKIYADPSVQSGVQYMSLLTLQKYSITQRESISVVLHNTQSLNKNIVDLKSDKRFKNVDIICLTDTWL